MVARSPNAKPDRQTAAALAAAAALNPALVRETLKKVDRCMARLQELQYTVAGGAKVVSGVSLSPRSTRGYLRTSIRCKQETVRMRCTPGQRKSPNGKFGGSEGAAQWQRMSLPAMLLGETVLEIVQASQFARDIVAVVDGGGDKNREPPRTPKPVARTRKATAESTPLRARRAREKQSQRGTAGAGAEAGTPPSRRRVRSRIQFKPTSPLGQPSVSTNRVSPKNREPPRTPKPVARTRKATTESTPLRARRAKEKQSQRGTAGAGAEAGTPPSRGRVRSRVQFKPTSPLGRPSVPANRVSPKNRPWAKKTVMFPNPTFFAPISSAAYSSPSPSKKQKRFYKTRSPVIARQTPQKFLVKSPPSSLGSKLKSQGKLRPSRPVAASPPGKAQAASGKNRRCSFSPSKLATRLVSPIKARLSLHKSRDGGVGSSMMSGLKQRPGVSLTARTVSNRISS